MVTLSLILCISVICESNKIKIDRVDNSDLLNLIIKPELGKNSLKKNLKLEMWKLSLKVQNTLLDYNVTKLVQYLKNL